jgi:propionate CoA-transferase
MNSVTREDLVERMTIGGEEYLFYKATPINVAFIRGTTADPDGNITMEHEALVLENLAVALAAKNSHGYVICQVERIAAEGTLDSRQVRQGARETAGHLPRLRDPPPGRPRSGDVRAG